MPRELYALLAKRGLATYNRPCQTLSFTTFIAWSLIAITARIGWLTCRLNRCINKIGFFKMRKNFIVPAVVGMIALIARRR